MTIGKKLVFSFLGLSLLVLLSGLVGVIVLKKASQSADIVGKEKAPVQYAVMNAALTLEKVQKLVGLYTNANDGLVDLEKQITASFDEFEMWLFAVQFGTDSKEFTSSPSGAVFKEKNLSIRLRKSSPAILTILENSQQLRAQWQNQIKELLTEHNRYVSFNIVDNGKTYALPEYLNLAQIHHLEWAKQLKDAVNIETTFTETTDLKQDMIGKWLTSYSVGNQEFMDLADKMLKQQTKLFELATAINAQEKFADKLSILNKGIGVISKIDKYFKSMHVSAAATYKKLEADKLGKFKIMTQSAELINAELVKLTSSADKEMQEALASAETVKKRGTISLIILTIAAVAIAIIMGSLISRYLARRILALADATKKIAQGDLQKTISTTSNDELGALAGDTNTMITNLRKMISQILNFSGNLSQSSSSLAEISNSLDNEAKSLNVKSAEATKATGAMSSSMLDISTIANESMERVHSVAQATEEMTATITEIAEKTETARSVASRAVITVEQTTQKMTELSEAAKEIGKVVDVIVNIADQTNLLSLNATIEAARAGDAGKGFAVVANEVKELAKQTNMATGDIRQKIEAIQHSSEMTISEINEISEIINNINSIVVVIARAVEEQAVTTRQITEDINSVSGGIDNMTRTVDATAETAASVSHDIGEVNTISGDVSSGSSRIRTSVDDLDRLAKELQILVEKFKL
jgi:methyl-accepting chemotaxis protein